MRLLSLPLLLATGIAASAAMGAQDRPVAQPVTPDPAPVAITPQPPTLQQQRALYGPGGLRPGAYRLMTTNGCLRVEPFRTAPEMPFLYPEYRPAECTRPDSIFYVLPVAGENLVTIRNVLNATTPARPTAVRGRIGYCATVARGVIFGAPRIDYLTCDAPDDGAGWRRAGAEDQRFQLRPGPGKGGYRILSVRGEDVKCWHFADALNTAECSDDPGDANQLIRFVAAPDWPAGYEAETLAAAGWAVGPDGPRRAVPVAGIDLPGNDHAAATSRDDRGEACQQACVADGSCRAWTWIRAGFNGNAKPMCYMKGAISRPVNFGTANLTIFSGIIRP